MLRIGRIDYANCSPIFSMLREIAPRNEYQFTSGVPSQLNALLASGELDVCPSSSFEYAVHPERYFIIPQISISSCGTVGSVLLLSRFPMDQLGGQTVLLSSESATSVNLLKILLAKRFGCSCRYERSSLPFGEALKKASAVLLIGDAALRAALQNPDVHIYDLGELWYDWTDLPFVFALWLCTKRAFIEQPEEVYLLVRHLQSAKKRAETSWNKIAEEAQESSWMGKERLVKYWRENISYDLGPRHIEGLAHFFRCCVELELMASEPDLHFLPTYAD